MENTKNLFLLPTDKPSRLMLRHGELFFFKDDDSVPKGTPKNQNIYITSYEQINENDYIITKDGRLVQVSYLLSKDLEGASKIILTTDQGLIKDGVQSIDDEFLEWFVKNPSCEEVEVYNWVSFSKKVWYYEPIIPKVGFTEPNIIDEWLDKNGNPEIAKEVEEEAKEIFDDLDKKIIKKYLQQ